MIEMVQASTPQNVSWSSAFAKPSSPTPMSMVELSTVFLTWYRGPLYFFVRRRIVLCAATQGPPSVS